METSANVGVLCPYCKMVHEQVCPLVKAFEYYETGALKRVEFKVPVDYALPVATPWVSDLKPVF
jgi:hypothetical protein